MAANPEANDLTAIYDDPDRARQAVLELERSGVDAGRIDVTDGGSSDRSLTGTDTRHTDMEATGYFGRRTAAGALVGIIAGAALGLLAGFAVAAATEIPAAPAVILGAVAGGLVVGTVVGGLFGGEAAMPVDSEAPSTTFEPGWDHVVRVHVRADDREEALRIQRTLEDTDPVTVDRS